MNGASVSWFISCPVMTTVTETIIQVIYVHKYHELASFNSILDSVIHKYQYHYRKVHLRLIQS